MYRYSSRMKCCAASLIALAVLHATCCGQLVITEVMSSSSHPGVDNITLLGGHANGDWWELTNTGTAPVDITGYLWDDSNRLVSPPNDYAEFPAIVVQGGESILVTEEDRDSIDIAGGFRDSWDLLPSVRIVARDEMLGFDLFSGLSGSGDEVNLYTPDRQLVMRASFPAATQGFSFEWDGDGTSLGTSVAGENGAYQALKDGSELPPPYPSLDVGSPGTYVATGVDPDFNDDGLLNCSDVDALVANIAAGSHTLSFDLSRDGQVTTVDLDQWLAQAGAANLPSGHSYQDGDANLSGTVDGSDFGVWNANKFTSVAAWCRGDFNANGVVDGSDFGIWNSNKFTSADGLASVPEPGVGLVPILAWIGWVGRNGTRGSSASRTHV